MPWRTVTTRRRVDEEHHLAELEDLVAVDVAGGLEHDEDGVAVAVELRALVGVQGVLDGERMQVPELGDLVELGLRRLGQADPREAAVGGGIRGGVGQRRRAGPADPAVVDPDVDDHRSIMAHGRDVDAARAARSSVVAGVAVRHVHGLRLRRPALAQEHRQHDDRAHGEELALPVLERLEPELGRPHEVPRVDARLTVLVLLGAVLVGAGDGVADERAEEEDGEREQQAVLVDDEPRPAAADGPRSVGVVTMDALDPRRAGRRGPASTRRSPSGRGRS